MTDFKRVPTDTAPIFYFCKGVHYMWLRLYGGLADVFE